MTNVIYYRLDVLAGSPEELRRITKRLKPCAFEPFGNLLYDCRWRKARRRYRALAPEIGMAEPLLSISAEFPSALFLLESLDDSYPRKRVIRAGQIQYEIFDDKRQSPVRWPGARNWALPEIFVPFETEWFENLEFGSLWQQWLKDVAMAVEALRSARHSLPEPGLQHLDPAVDSL